MKSLIAVITLSLRTLSNIELVATNNAVQCWGKVNPQNLAFEKLKKLTLIKDNGDLWDDESMKAACAYEVNRRIAEGTFN